MIKHCAARRPHCILPRKNSSPLNCSCWQDFFLSNLSFILQPHRPRLNAFTKRWNFFLINRNDIRHFLTIKHKRTNLTHSYVDTYNQKQKIIFGGVLECPVGINQLIRRLFISSMLSFGWKPCWLISTAGIKTSVSSALETSVPDPWHFGVDPDPRIHAFN